MRKSIGALLGLVAVLSACGAPMQLAAPAAVGTMAASTRTDMGNAERLFNILEAHYQTEAPSVMCLADRKYGPAFGFITVAPKPTDKALTEVNVGSITNGGKITTMISFASRISRASNPQLEQATAAIRDHVAHKIGTTITQLIVSTNPTGHDKYAYLAIGSRPNDTDPQARTLTWFHAGTYAVGSKTLNSITDFGTSLVK